VILEFGRTAAEVHTITVLNAGTEAMNFRIYPADFDQDDAGEHQFIPPGEHPRSCSSGLRASQTSLRLEPGEKQPIQIRLPPVARTCWSLLFVETSGTLEAGIRATQRVGVKVYGVAPGMVNDGDIGSVVAASVHGRIEAAVTFRNLGGAPVRPKGRLEIRTYGGAVVAASEMEPFSVLPGYTRRVATHFEAPLPAGRYLAIPILDFGGEYLAGGQAAFEVP
jgi:hypothetical protein